MIRTGWAGYLRSAAAGRAAQSINQISLVMPRAHQIDLVPRYLLGIVKSLEISAPMLAALPNPMTVLFAMPCIIPLRR